MVSGCLSDSPADRRPSSFKRQLQRPPTSPSLSRAECDIHRRHTFGNEIAKRGRLAITEGK